MNMQLDMDAFAASAKASNRAFRKKGWISNGWNSSDARVKCLGWAKPSKTREEILRRVAGGMKTSGTIAAKIGANPSYTSKTLQEFMLRGYCTRTGLNGCTYRYSITDAGRAALAEWEAAE